jgi:hypothetical protein
MFWGGIPTTRAVDAVVPRPCNFVGGSPTPVLHLLSADRYRETEQLLSQGRAAVPDASHLRRPNPARSMPRICLGTSHPLSWFPAGSIEPFWCWVLATSTKPRASPPPLPKGADLYKAVRIWPVLSWPVSSSTPMGCLWPWPAPRFVNANIGRAHGEKQLNRLAWPPQSSKLVYPPLGPTVGMDQGV